MAARLRLLLALVMVAAFAVPAGGATAENAEPTATPVGVAKNGASILRDLPSAESLIGVATYPGRTPTAEDRSKLESLGLEVQLMRNLPLAIVRGPVSGMLTAVDRGYAFDIYPNEQMELYDRESSAAINAHRVWDDLGYDGTGVGVAVIDTGVDGTHDDLAERVTHNIKILGSEHVESYNNAFSIVVPVDEGPYNNTDTTSGHGTHVAGIVAADGSGDPDLLGVAPGADIIGYGAGDLLFLYTVIASFDHVLENHEEWGIKATNNSWGSAFRQFDPLHPINLATKALHEEGIVTVFAAGNSSEEMQLNPWSLAPWVISVGSTTLSAERSSFSSRGLMYDNSLPVELPEDGHVRFTGDRIGVYNPDVTAPGSNITSTGTPTGAGILAPSEPSGTATISGTSMAAPHVAGLVALLFEANPDLTPDQVKQALQVTATDMRDGSAFWEAGYGFVDAKAAIELVTSNRFRNAPDPTLRVLQRQKDREVLASREYSVLVSDHFWFTTLPATAFGSDMHEFTFEVDERTDALRGTVAFSADLGVIGWNLLHSWGLVLKDAEGTVIAESETSGDAGLGHFHVDLDEVAEAEESAEIVFGEWTLEVWGDFHRGAGTQTHDRVSVAVAQLERQDATVTGPTFEPTGELELFFAGGGEGSESAGEGSVGDSGASTAPAAPVSSPEGCDWSDDGVASGGLTTVDLSDHDCEAGFAGYAWNYAAGIPVEFVSAPLESALTVGGEAIIVTYLAETLQPAWSNALGSTLAYEIAAVGPDGDVIAIAGGDIEETPAIGPTPERGEYAFEVPVTEIPEGYSIRTRMFFSGFYTSAMRMSYGGGDFADSGLTLTLGSLNGAVAASGGDEQATAAPPDLPATGGTPAWMLLGLVLLGVAIGTRRKLTSET